METAGKLTVLKNEKTDSLNLEMMSSGDFVNYMCNSLWVENAVIVEMTNYSRNTKCPVKPVNRAIEIKMEPDDVKLLGSCTGENHGTHSDTYQSSKDTEQGEEDVRERSMLTESFQSHSSEIKSSLRESNNDEQFDELPSKLVDDSTNQEYVLLIKPRSISECHNPVEQCTGNKSAGDLTGRHLHTVTAEAGDSDATELVKQQGELYRRPAVTEQKSEIIESFARDQKSLWRPVVEYRRLNSTVHMNGINSTWCSRSVDMFTPCNDVDSSLTQVSALESRQTTLEQRENLQLSPTSCVMIDQPAPMILGMNGQNSIISAISAEQQLALQLENIQPQTLQRGQQLRSNTLEKSEQEVGLVVSSTQESSETCSRCRHCSAIGTMEDNTTVSRKVDARATSSCQVNLHRYDDTRSDKQPPVCNDDSRVVQSEKSLKSHIVGHKLSLGGSDLVEHTHEYNYVCAECTAAFTRKQLLVEHMTSHTGISSFLCKICDESFEHRRSLISHSRNHFKKGRYVCSVNTSLVINSKRISQKQRHTGEKQHVCTICSKVFPRRERLIRHIRIHTYETPYVCTTCSKGFAQKGQLNSHIRTHTGEKPHVCTACSKRFVRKEHLIRHIRTHTGEKPQVCTTCSKMFVRKEHLIRHIRIHTGEKPYVCTTCSKGFAQQWQLKGHTRTHTGEQPYVCTTCSKGFALMGHLTRHIRIHTGEKPYACTTCSKRFSQKEQLEEHKRTHTGEKPHVCATCSKGFAHKRDLNRHTKTHTGEKPHVCTTCSKGFSQGRQLREHTMTHTGEKPHVCTTCSKRFVRKEHLIRHTMIHTHDEPYVCPTCSKGFAQKGQLKEHTRTHTGEKSHLYATCSKGFAQKCDLNRHTKTHTGEKPHVCTICSKKFALLGNLIRHIRIHTEEKPYVCTTCSKEFSDKRDLVMHIVRTHTAD